jgi:hypothetical protein
MNKETQICIGGGGFAGSVCACFLAQRLPSARIRLFERDTSLMAGFRRMAERPGRGAVDETTDPVAEIWRGVEFGRQLFFRFNAFAWDEWLRTFSPQAPRGCIRPAALADALEAELERRGVEVVTGRKLTEFRRESSGRYRIWFDIGNPMEADALVLATGGGRSHMLKLLGELGHAARDGGPAMLGLRLSGAAAKGLAGEEWDEAEVRWQNPQTGNWKVCRGTVQWRQPFLEGSAIARLTGQQEPEFWRGPGVHKLQVARIDAALGAWDSNRLGRWLEEAGGREIVELAPEGVGTAHWRTLLQQAKVSPQTAARSLGKREVQALASGLRGFTVKVKGFRQWKDEFSQEGGLELDSWDPTRLESRLSPGLFAIGEMLDLDGEPDGTNLHLAAAAAAVVSDALKSSRGGA